jgi:signal transduction histidine kinase/CheY-like chemotaxis protein
MHETETVRDIRLEAEFHREFRMAGMKWVGYAAFAAGLLFLAFAVLAAVGLPHSVEIQFVRILAGVMLLCVAYCMSRRVGVTSGNYVFVAACTSSVALMAAVVSPLLLEESSLDVSSQATPALMFGLFLHYAFLRLPIAIAASIGWALWLLAIYLFPAPINADAVVRLVLYVAFANTFGMVILFLIESRERSLFLQKREALAAQREARERQLAAEDAERGKTRLIAAISHDLRQPMTAASAYAELILARLFHEDCSGARAAALKVQIALKMLGATLDSLLTSARYESGAESIEIRKVDLRAILQSVYEANVSDAERRGVEFRVRLPRQRLALDTHWLSLHRVLGNLVANAIKFSYRGDEAGRVLVAARLRKGVCRIDVFDTGVGIPRELMQKVWEPFVQLNNVDRDRERGLGLGLFLVGQVMTQLPGHSVEMDSQLGRGSRFTVMIPASESERSELEEHVHSPVCEDGCLSLLIGGTVLIVEDDRSTRESLRELLEDWRAVTVTAASADEVVSVLVARPRRIDAIICDYRLASGANGIDAIAKLRQTLGYAPHAVLITGEADVEPLRARAGPDTVVLQKPFSPEVLARLLLEAVRVRGRADPG